MTRTTIDIDGDVLEALRERGRREGRTIGSIASEMLSAAIATGEQAIQSRPFTWHTQRLESKVDLESDPSLDRFLYGP